MVPLQEEMGREPGLRRRLRRARDRGERLATDVTDSVTDVAATTGRRSRDAIETVTANGRRLAAVAAAAAMAGIAFALRRNA